MNWQSLWSFVKDRFGERSSATGLVQMIVGLTGMQVSDTTQAAIVSVIVAIVGLLQVFIPDKAKQ